MAKMGQEEHQRRRRDIVVESRDDIPPKLRQERHRIVMPLLTELGTLSEPDVIQRCRAYGTSERTLFFNLRMQIDWRLSFVPFADR